MIIAIVTRAFYSLSFSLILNINPTLANMNKEKFWNHIETAYTSCDDQPIESDYLVEIFSEFDKDELVEAALILDNLTSHLNNENTYSMASLLTGDTLSDDSFLYFRSWLVTLGPTVSHLAIIDPISLVKNESLGERLDLFDIEPEEFHYFIYDAYEAKYGELESFYDIYEKRSSQVGDIGSAQKSKVWKFNSIDEIASKFPTLNSLIEARYQIGE